MGIHSTGFRPLKKILIERVRTLYRLNALNITTSEDIDILQWVAPYIEAEKELEKYVSIAMTPDRAYHLAMMVHDDELVASQIVGIVTRSLNKKKKENAR